MITLEEYQKIAAGEIKDPTYLFWLNSTKVANLNANTKFLNNMLHKKFKKIA